jgi:hypothetical protein
MTTSGKKYDAALKWNVLCVGLEWLVQSIERGMALDAKYFTLDIDPFKRGEGAWDRALSLTTQSRFTTQSYDTIPPEFDNGNKRRRIRRTQSTAQEGIWEGIMGAASNMQSLNGHSFVDESAAVNFEMPIDEAPSMAGFAEEYDDVPRGLFEGMGFYTWGFTDAEVSVI